MRLLAVRVKSVEVGTVSECFSTKQVLHPVLNIAGIAILVAGFFFFFFWLAGSFDLTSFLLGSRHFGYDYFKGFGSGTTVVLTGHFIASAEHCKGRLSLGKISVGVKTSPSPGRITHKFEWICVQ